MKSLRASNTTIIINLCSSHFTNATNTVVKCTSVLVLIIISHSLISQEMTILSNRKILMLQEIIQFSLTLHTWIFHQIIKKINKRLKRQTLTHKFKNTLADRPMNFFAIIKHLTILDLNPTLTKCSHSSLNIYKFQQLIFAGRLQTIHNQPIVNMIRQYLMSLIFKDQRKIAINPHKRNTHYISPVSCEIKLSNYQSTL